MAVERCWADGSKKVPPYSIFMDFKPPLEDATKKWLTSHGYVSPSFIARGRSGAIWKVGKDGKFFAMKVEHEKSRRLRMVEQEVQLLRMANQIGVGPKVEEVDMEHAIIIMALVEGITLGKWVDTTESRVKMERGLTRLFGQARKLDRAGIDHGQLGGKLHNILMDAGDQPTILDFEKASYVRSVHNVGQLKGVLLGGHTDFSKKVLKVWPEAEEELHF